MNNSVSASSREASACSTASEAAYSGKASLSETSTHDWYIRVKLSFQGTAPSSIAAQIAYIEQKATKLHDSLKSQLNLQDVGPVSKRFMDESDERTEKVYTCYWLIGLPIIPPAEIAETRATARAWDDELFGENMEKRTVQARFVKLEAILKQNLKPDIQVESLLASEAKAPKAERKKAGESFKKIKGSNPAQVRKQFLHHVMGAEASGSQAGKGKSSGGKLRPAIDVLNRLKYDGRYNVEEYVVGYIDRKAGTLEKSIVEWEEYDEQDLIAYFRHVPGNEIVWDRARKIDLVFNR